jgi:hypothetical protein
LRWAQYPAAAEFCIGEELPYFFLFLGDHRCGPSLDFAPNKFFEVSQEIKAAAADFQCPGPLSPQLPHGECLRLMAEIARRIFAGHASIRQHPNADLLDLLDPIYRPIHNRLVF